MKKLLSPLSVAISMALYGFSPLSYAACSYDNGSLTLDNATCTITNTLVTDTTATLNITSSTDINSQGQIRLNTDLSTSDSTALNLDESLGLRYTMQIGHANAANITSDKVAILYNGTKLRANSDGFNLLNSSTVKGGTYAFYVPNLTANTLRITLTQGSIDGNIYLASDSSTRHMILVPTAGQGNIRSSLIEGVYWVTVQGTGKLTLQSGSTGSNWTNAHLYTYSGSDLVFLLEDLSLVNNSTPLLTTASTTLENGTNVILDLGDFSLDDIDGKQIILINSANLSDNRSTSDSIAIYQNGTDISSTIPSATGETQKENEWLASTTSYLNTMQSNGQLSLLYNSNGVLTVVADKSKTNFLANTEYNVSFIDYLLDNSLGTGNAREALLLRYPTNANAATLSRQLTPDLSGADFTAGLLWGEQMRSHIQDRLLAYQHQLPLYEREEGWNVWAASAYGKGKKSALYGYKINRYGLHLGLDRQVNTEGLIGFSVGVNRNNIKPQFSAIDKKITQLLFMPYFEYNGERYFAHGNLLAGAYFADSQRTIGDSKATGDYTGFHFGYQLTGGLNAQFAKLNFRPYVSLKEQWLQSEAYSEEGSPFALEVARQKYKARHIGGGFALWQRYDLAIGKFVPSVEIEYYKQMGDRHFTPQYRLAGDSANAYGFSLYGLTGNQFSTKLNGRLDISENLNISASLSYHKLGGYQESVVGFTLSNRF